MRIQSVAATIAVLFLSAPAAFAQVADTADPSAATMAEIDTIAVMVWPKTAVTLPETDPVAATFSLGQIQGIAPHLLSGVTARGFARKVTVEDETIGQVLVMSVARGDREEVISTEGLAAQFDARETSELFPEKNLELTGSKSALIAALERLAQAVPAEGEKKDVTDPVSENPVSGGGTSNDEASAYRTPAAAPASAPEEDDPVVEVRTSTDGCPVRIDLAQDKAFQQSKVQTFSDGILSNEGQCADSEISFPLKRSYLACPQDIVELPAMTAWAQYSLFYTNNSGENRMIGDCTKDEETAYVISESEGQCPIFLDFNAGRAVPQSALTYVNRNNAVVQARGCADSTLAAALPMTESTANCSLRHDFGAGRSAELAMWTYVRGGVTYQAAPCADNGRIFTHETIYADAGSNYICPPITNMDAKTITLQSRKRITIDGINQYITECTPDTTTQAILATTDGCTDPSKWTHDLDASVSYGQERFYYSKANGMREYVTLCQNSAATYTHSVTVTGYQHNDAELWSYPLTTVRITIGGSQYTIASSTVLPGATQWSYVRDGTYEGKTGESVYEPPSGCNAYRLTALFERWKRPDDTEYSKVIGTGAPEGPVNACTIVVQAPVWNKTRDWTFCHNGWGTCDARGGAVASSYSDYRGDRKLRREDGLIVSQTSMNTNVAGNASQSSYCGCDSYPPHPGTPYTGVETLTWNQVEGW